MPFPVFPFLFRRRRHKRSPTPQQLREHTPHPPIPEIEDRVRRHFFNEPGFQTYGSFFSHWDGHITAGHVVSECGEKVPPFSNGHAQNWPDGLDAALIGCKLPDICPPAPISGQSVKCIGFPAGSHHAAIRTAKVYIERPNAPDTWIARIITPDEPVVTGMSGGAVIDIETNEPIGILITRNSPADLNNDRDPDESFDFISLHGVWNAITKGANGENYV